MYRTLELNPSEWIEISWPTERLCTMRDAVRQAIRPFASDWMWKIRCVAARERELLSDNRQRLQAYARMRVEGIEGERETEKRSKSALGKLENGLTRAFVPVVRYLRCQWCRRCVYTHHTHTHTVGCCCSIRLIVRLHVEHAATVIVGVKHTRTNETCGVGANI